MPTRRQILSQSAAVAAALASAGLLPAQAQVAWSKAAFEAKSVDEVYKALGISKPVESKDVTLTVPEIAENGAAVPVSAATTLPNVKQISILIEKNPTTLAATFELTEGVESQIATRVKMAQSSNVYAVAQMADGRVLFARKEVKVTLGGCGA